MSNSKENKKFGLINWNSIAIGSIIILTGFILVTDGSLPNLGEYLELFPLIFLILVLPPIIGGFATAYLNKPKYRVGIIHGLFTGLISVIIFNLYDLFTYGIQYNIFYILASIMWNLVPITVLVIFGAFIGTSIKKLIRN